MSGQGDDRAGRPRPRGSSLPSNIPKRGLTPSQAAEYCGCETIEAFNTWVRRGIVPGPIPGTHRWDKKAIDAALDRASGLTSEQDSSFEAWARAQAE